MYVTESYVFFFSAYHPGLEPRFRTQEESDDENVSGEW